MAFESMLDQFKTYGGGVLFAAARRKLRMRSAELRRRMGAPQELPYEFAVTPPRYVHTSLEPRPDPKTINWVIPPFVRGAGGHRTIFRMARDLEAAGFDNEFYIAGESLFQTDAEATQAMRAFFYDLRGSVHVDLNGMRPCHSVFATAWETAYPVHAFQAARRKLYFVQDDEPAFFPASSGNALADATYRFGFDCVCAGPWLEEKMRGLGARAVSFRLAYDPEVYRLPDPARVTRGQRERPRVVFYARHITQRRGVELGFLALTLLKRRRPEVEVVFFGATDSPYKLEFDAVGRGKLREDELAELYASATVGLSISLSNYSLIPQEMLATGLPVVETNHPSLQLVYPEPGPALKLVPPEPYALAAALEAQIDAALEAPVKMSTAAASLVHGLAWDDAAAIVAQELRFTPS